jgi:hypothetical protein
MDAWVTLAYTISNLGALFNWETIILSQFSIMIEKFHKTLENPGVVLSFYMASYLLDIVY